MFRKPKKSKKAALRKKRKEGDDDEREGEGEESTSQLVDEARRAAKKSKASATSTGEGGSSNITTMGGKSRVMHQFEASSSEQVSAAELATSTAQHHPEAKEEEEHAGKGEDGIFRDKTRNKFLAGPLKASAFVRTTCRFDYQPDICKDYKDTGFCGFGDTCIYLHDRGDTMSGWQLEKEWEDKKKAEQAKKEKEMDAFANGTSASGGDSDSKVMEEDGLPFACHICREAFTDPVITPCGHYFCEKCIMNHVRNNGNACPICNKDTHGVFNLPTKLLAKKRRLVGSRATWKEFAEAVRNKILAGGSEPS